METIPRILHQFSATSELPERYAALAESWRLHHPGWEYRLWTEESVAALVAEDPSFRAIVDADPTAVRFLILRRFGGVYVDLEVEAFRSIEPLLEGCTLAIASEPDEHLLILAPSLIASAPAHPFWDHVLAQPRDALPLLTRAFVDFAPRATIRLLAMRDVYPVDKDRYRSGSLFHLLSWDDATRDATAHHHRADVDRERLPPALLRQETELINADRCERPADPAEPLPLISALMVTCDRPSKARLALDCFRRQTYPNKELVILVTGTDETLSRDVAQLADPRIRVVYPPKRDVSLGELRNVAIDAAAGSFVCGWDDDDLFHPFRLEVQMDHIRRTGAQASILSRCTLWWVSVPRFAISHKRPWENSIMCRKDVMPRYPAIDAGEDRRMFGVMMERTCVAKIDQPRLYLYIVHGTNTWYPTHFDRFWRTAERTFEADRAVRMHRELARDLPLDAYAQTC